MKTSTKYILIILIIVIGLGLWFKSKYLPAKVPEPIPQENTQGDAARYMDIESYVRNSITDISPVRATMGGTFYVTSISAQNGVGVVSYEDGHSAYTADFTYNVNSLGQPGIISFTIRP